MSLMYDSKNDVRFTRPQLQELALPPAQGRFHNPVPFGDYTEIVADALDRNGIEIQAEEYAVSKDGSKFFGLMEVAPKRGELITADEWTLQVGLRGSHDQSIPRGLTLGSRVLVCSNLCFHGDIGVFTTKQTTNVLRRLPHLVYDAVAHVPQMAERQERAFEAYRNYELKPRWGDAALVEIYRRGGLTAAQLGRAIGEWDQPSYDEHTEQGFTAWRLFNAATQALKPTGERVNMELVRERSQVTHGFIDELVGVAA